MPTSAADQTVVTSRSCRVTSLGNAGFRFASAGVAVLVDPCYDPSPGVADPPLAEVDTTDLVAILVTHAHPDHCRPDTLKALARRCRVPVLGPPAVARLLRGPGVEAVVCDPPRRRRPAAGVEHRWPGLTVTAAATCHGQEHLSFLIGLGGFRVLHDGDNEDLSALDPAWWEGLDVACLGPWQGSGWDRQLATRPPRIAVICHLTAEERDEHRRGVFFPAMTALALPPLTVLAPGEEIEVPAVETIT
jgi:hypothetical protein